MKVVRRIEVRAVVRDQVDHLDRPSLAIGKVLLPEAGEERRDLVVSILVREVLDLRSKPGGSLCTSFSR